MSFRDKSALVTIVALLIASVVYVVSLVSAAGGKPLVDVAYQPYLIGFVIVLVIVSVVGQIAVAVRSPKEATAPRDERERLITWRAGSVSAYVLEVGAFLAIALAMAQVDWFWIANTVLALWVLAEIVDGGVQLSLSRRGV
ncbi:MAG: hypothetical protein U0R76_13455 [Candidatus Nanopelagicales bacterium]